MRGAFGNPASLWRISVCRLVDTGRDVLRRKLEETPELEGRFRKALSFLEPANVRSATRLTLSGDDALCPGIISFGIFGMSTISSQFPSYLWFSISKVVES